MTITVLSAAGAVASTAAGAAASTSVGSIILTALFSLLVLGGSFYLLAAIIAMWRSPDALSRLNQLSAGILVGIPALVLANMLHQFDVGSLTWGRFATGLVAIVAVLVVASTASEVLGRAVLGARDGSAEDYVPEGPLDKNGVAERNKMQ